MDEERVKSFRLKCKTGQTFGMFCKSCDPAFVEVIGHAGFDFAILDMEHGPADFCTVQNLVRACEATHLLPVVRVDSLAEEKISKALDIGAAGVQIPQISTAEQARRAVRAARFFPQGERGVCRFVRAAEYSAKPRDEYFTQAGQVLTILQLEGVAAVRNVDEILSVPGVDIIFIGPYDLSQSIGVPGQTTHPKVLQAMETILAKAKEKNVLVGTFTDSAQTLEMWVRSGVQYISHSVDAGVFYEACTKAKGEFEKAVAKEEHEVHTS